MTLSERIKWVRKVEGLNQQQFADALGLSKSIVAKYETDQANVPDRAIKEICRTFKVSESWLKDGYGSMHEDISRTQQISNFIDGVMLESNDDFKKRLVLYLSKLTVQDWEALSQIAKKLKEDED